jgi:hypothetical protein
VRYLILLTSLILWAGCKGGVDKTLVEVVEETYPLDPSGSLHVKNVDGLIRLYGSDEPAVHIRATKRAYSAERLQALRMQVSSGPESVSVETIFPTKEKWGLRDRSGVVDYVIVAPQYLKTVEAELVNGEISIDGLRGGSVRATVVNGRLSARDSFANLDFDAKNGAIDFYYDWWEGGAYLVGASIPNGGIGMFFPNDASFHVEAETQGGSIISNLIDADEHPREHRKELRQSFGSEPGPTFKFHAVSGNIRIRGY